MSARLLEHDWFPQPLPANVELGSRSWLYSSFAFVHYQSRRKPGVSIGNDTGLYAGTFFDLGPDGQVVIGDYCSLVGAIFCTDERMTIGDYVFIAHEVVLADTEGSLPPQARKPGRRVTKERGISIADDVWIGAGAVLLGGARIGKGSVVGAAAVVDFEVPPYVVVAGNPATVIRSIDASGHSRRGNP